MEREVFLSEMREGSHVLVGEDGAPLFLMVWTEKLMEIMGHNDKYLTTINANIVCMSEKFKVMNSLIVIVLWLEGGDSLDEYLSKL